MILNAGGGGPKVKVAMTQDGSNNAMPLFASAR